MALVRGITKKLDIPGENEHVIIRKLTWKQLEAAAEKRADTTTQKMRAMGGDVLGTINKLVAEKNKQDAEDLVSRKQLGRHQTPLVLDGKTGAAVDESQAVSTDVRKPRKLLNDFDLGTVLEFGVANMSYCDGKFEKKDVYELDKPTAEYVGEEILKFSGVGTESELEAATKND